MKTRTMWLCSLLVSVAASSTFGALADNASVFNMMGADVRFSMNFAGMAVDLGEVYFEDGSSQTLGIGGAFGYVPAMFDPTGGGGMFVLYDANRQVIADVNALGQSSNPGVFPNLGLVLADQRNIFTAFGLGTISVVENPDGNVVGYPQTRPGGPGSTQQLTFLFRDLKLAVASPTATNFESGVLFNPLAGWVGTGGLTVSYLTDTGVFSFFQDATTDAHGTAYGLPGKGGAPAGELPTAFFDPNNTGGNEYFDPNGDSRFRYADPSDPDETEVLRLANVGDIFASIIFNADLRGPSHTSHGAPVHHPGLDLDLTIISGGRSSFSDHGPSLAITGGAWHGEVLEGYFRVTSDVAFGAGQTGVLPEDPFTFAFQTPSGGGPEFFGGTVVPEPTVALTVMTGLVALYGLKRRRF